MKPLWTPKVLNAPDGLARWACGAAIRTRDVLRKRRQVKVCRKVRDHWVLRLGKMEVGHRFEFDRYEYLLRRPRWELLQFPELDKWYWSPVPQSRVLNPKRNNRAVRLLRRKQ